MAKQNKQTDNKSFGKKKIFKIHAKEENGEITLTFPKKVLDYIDSAGDVFWIPINGVIQICGSKPHMVIPMISVNDNSFLPQDENPVVEEE